MGRRKLRRWRLCAEKEGGKVEGVVEGWKGDGGRTKVKRMNGSEGARMRG